MDNFDAVNELRNFRCAIDEATMVVHLTNEGVVTFVNKNFCELSGYEENELCGNRVQNLLQFNKPNLIDKAFFNLNKGISWKGEIKFKGKLNQRIWMHCTVVPLNFENGNAKNYMAILVDITARKIFEEEIVNSENKYKNVVNSVKEVIFQLDILGEWTFLNQAWTEITGINIIESIGNNFLSNVFEDDKIKAQNIFEFLINKNAEYSSSLLRFNTQKNSIRICEVFARIIYDEKGKVTGLSGTLNDVTEKRQSEELIQQSNSFQKAILDSAKQVIISTDKKGIILTYNLGAEKILGYKPDKLIGKQNIEILLKSVNISTKNDSQNKVSEINIVNWIEEHISNPKEEQIEEEISLFSIDKKEIPVMLSLTAIKKENDDISGYLFIANDISKRKKAESENIKLNKILEETPDFVVYYDLKNKPLFTNKAYNEIRFDNEGRETKISLHPEWADIILRKKAIPYAIEFGSWKGETAIINKDGKEIPVLQLIIIHKDENGNPVFRSSVMRDITQRKEYEHRLLQSEKRNRDLINYSQGVICTHDLEGNILSINPAGYELIGYSLEELVGIPITEFMEVENRERFKTEYLQSFGKNRTAEGILSLLHKNGRKVHLLYKNYKVNEPNGETYIIGFAQDITERLQAETELKNAKLTAEESLKTKELFLANMSHEIRTPMNGIVGLTSLLLRSPLNEKQNQYAVSVKQSAENLLVIINDILDFSKINAGKLELNKIPFDLSDLLYNLSQTFQIEAQRKGISFSTILEDNVHSIIAGDQVRLNQILVNLISNAIKFTEKGSVSISIKRVSENKQATRLSLKISDTGIGINEDKLKKVFQSFTQANSDTTKNYGGTGLGLSIAKSLLELMGSQIKVKSTIGKGSTFYFEINLEKASKIAIQTITNTEINLSGKLENVRILLAEDNKVNQLFANELLTDWGVQIDIADNGSIAYEYIKKNKYDLVLMDIQMPIMDGIEATAKIRNDSNPWIRNIPIIAMTANAMKGDDEKYKKVGMNEVVFKPFESLELYNKISKQLRINKPTDLNVKCLDEKKYTLPPQKIQNELLKFQFANLEVISSFSRGKNSFILKMLNVIIETVPNAIFELEREILKNNWQSVNKIAHKLIPNMNMMGNSFLETEMKWIEDNALQIRNQASIRDRWNEMKPFSEKVFEELKIAKLHYEKLEVTNENK